MGEIARTNGRRKHIRRCTCNVAVLVGPHTIIAMELRFIFFTRSNRCVKNIIAIIMVCYYIPSQRIMYIRYDFVYLKFSFLHDLNISLCKNILKMQA
jgi:hypothetical protein